MDGFTSHLSSSNSIRVVVGLCVTIVTLVPFSSSFSNVMLTITADQYHILVAINECSAVYGV
jgi:hypothetical protein